MTQSLFDEGLYQGYRFEDYKDWLATDKGLRAFLNTNRVHPG
jgi:hypothetical protein